MAQQVLSIRNHPKVTDNGHAYVFDKRSKDDTLLFYRCDKRNGQVEMGKLPTTRAIKQSINRQLNKIGAMPANPLNLQDLAIPELFKYYCPDEDTRELYVLAKSGPGDERVIIFGRESSAAWAHLMQVLYADGTFSISPAMFYQVFVLLAKQGTYVLPVAYGLLPNKSRESYERFFPKRKKY